MKPVMLSVGGAMRKARTDTNQKELVKVMRQMGMSVAVTSSAHDGFTDTVVGFGGVTVLVEIKDGNKSLSRRKLTPAQVVFHDEFKGAITVIETVDQAIELVKRIKQASASLKVDWNVGAQAYA